MPRALIALALLGLGVPHPEWQVSVSPVGDHRFQATLTATLPDGYYQDAESPFLTVKSAPEAGWDIESVERSEPVDRRGHASYTGRFTQTLTLVARPGAVVSPQVDLVAGWQICQIDGACLLPSQTTLSLTVPPVPPPGPPWGYLGAAFVGGLLLNLMPCVFPVLALKGLTLAGRRRRGLAAALGTWGALTLLGLITATGAALGQRWDWGFAFQSPVFVTALAVVFGAFAAALAGVWRVPSLPFSLTRPGRESWATSLAGGALVVVAAAPCTAPFLGPAVGWAFTQAPATILAVFSVAGAGLALPGLLLTLVPGLRRLLPAPGPWMGVIEKVAAGLLGLTAVYLGWIAFQQKGWLVVGLGALWVVGVGAWKLGALPWGGRGAVLAALMTLAAVAWPAPRPTPPPLPPGWEAFTPARLADLRARGTPVLVDGTAAWCATCQVNEAAVLTRPDVAALLEARGVVRLRADDTLPSAEIEAWMASVDRAGLPVYALYRGPSSPVLFPELLTDDNFTRVIAALPPLP